MPFNATCMKGRANYLCLHRFEALRDQTAVSRRGDAAARIRARPYDARMFLTIIDAWAARTETGDRAEIADLPEDLAALERRVRKRRELPRRRLPALRRVLRDAHAPARRRVGRGDRQPSPAVRGRGAAPPRLRRGDSRLPRTRCSTKRTSSKTWPRSTSASSVSTWRRRGPGARHRALVPPACCRSPQRGRGARRRRAPRGAMPAASFPALEPSRTTRRRARAPDRRHAGGRRRDAARTSSARSTGSRRTLLLVHQQPGPGGEPVVQGRAAEELLTLARRAKQTAGGPPLPAARLRCRLRLLPRGARARRVPEGGADRRVADGARVA